MINQLKKIRDAIRSKKWVQYTFLVIYVAIFLAVFLPHFFYHTQVGVDQEKTLECLKTGQTINLTISSSGFSPKQVKGRVCDKLVIKNIGQDYHQVAFGPHPAHLNYPGFEEKLLGPGEENSFILKAWGNYELHDHLNENLEAALEISKD